MHLQTTLRELAGFQSWKIGALALVTSLLLPIVLWTYQDFKAYLALGSGGTPSNFLGYLRVKILSLFALDDPYLPAPVSQTLCNQRGYLIRLPDRGPRPVTKGIAPHRQITQKASDELFDRLANAIQRLCTTTDRLVLGTSCFEKHSTGLFSISPIRKTCQGEICHAHPSDGSMHLTLHPLDVKLVLEARWGERHPLARGGWLERFVPSGFIMMYAPRGEQDIEIVIEIVKAAEWYVKGGENEER